MKIGDRSIGPGHPVAIVCEISGNHCGSLLKAIQLIAAAKEAGADFIKLQAYTVSEMLDLRGDGPAPPPWEGMTLTQIYEKAQTPHEWFPCLVEVFDLIKIPWFASVFGPQSLALLEDLGCPAYKIAAWEYGKGDFRRMVEAKGKPVIRSMPEQRPASCGGMSAAMLCPPGYPQKDARLGWIRNGYLGYSYHGTDVDVPIYAVTAGAKIIEAHLMLEGDEPLDKDFSLTPQEFRSMVAGIRSVEAML